MNSFDGFLKYRLSLSLPSIFSWLFLLPDPFDTLPLQVFDAPVQYLLFML